MAAAAVAAVLAVGAIALVAFYAPVDQDGLNQKIFYFHVPIALTAYACFGLGAIEGRFSTSGRAAKSATSRATWPCTRA